MKITFDIDDDLYTREMIKKITDNIKVALEEYKKEQVWPRIDDIYYYISACGEIIATPFAATGFDNGCLSFGDCFKTREKAEFKREQLKVMHELEQLADDDQEWDGCNPHYNIYYDYEKKDVGQSCVGLNRYNMFYFKSEESALAAINKIGKDRLKRYYFGVKDGE